MPYAIQFYLVLSRTNWKWVYYACYWKFYGNHWWKWLLMDAADSDDHQATQTSDQIYVIKLCQIHSVMIAWNLFSSLSFWWNPQNHNFYNKSKASHFNNKTKRTNQMHKMRTNDTIELISVPWFIVAEWNKIDFIQFRQSPMPEIFFHLYPSLRRAISFTWTFVLLCSFFYIFSFVFREKWRALNHFTLNNILELVSSVFMVMIMIPE